MIAALRTDLLVGIEVFFIYESAAAFTFGKQALRPDGSIFLPGVSDRALLFFKPAHIPIS